MNFEKLRGGCSLQTAGLLSIFILSFFAGLFAYFYIEPFPIVFDESGYILQAETFASGRLANPTPKLSQYFQAFGIILDPVYAAKFPPMQGLLLAFGKIVFNDMTLGLIFFYALSAASCYWCLKSWTGNFSALLIACWYGLNPLHINSWVLTFWGGIPAALGGFLLLGAAIRALRSESSRNFLLIGLALGLLLLSRPYEGALLALPVLLYLLFRRRLKIYLSFLVFFLFLGFQGYYNYVLTGNSFKFSAEHYDEQYGRVPPFIFQKLIVPQIKDIPENLRRYHENERVIYADRTSENPWQSLAVKFGDYFLYFLPWPLLLIIIFNFRNPKNQEQKFIWFTFVFVWLAAIIPVTFRNMHYAAPLLAPLYILIASSVEILRAKIKSSLIRRTVLTLVFLFSFWQHYEKALKEREIIATSPCYKKKVYSEYLKALPGKSLVLVSYNQNYKALACEYVYNSSDVFNQKVIWARSDGMGNHSLIKVLSPQRVLFLENGILILDSEY